MISQLTSAPPVTLSREDRRIAMGARTPAELEIYSRIPRQRMAFTHLRACAMRMGDRSDYAKMLALVDGD